MRAVILTALVLFGLPAAAQDVYCEAVVSNGAGEVVAGYTLAKDGTRKSSLLSWMPVRDKYESFDAEFMTSPRLMLHFRLGRGDRLVGPTSVNIVTTQYSVPGTGEASPLALVRIEAIAMPSGRAVSWKGSEPEIGEPSLAKLLRSEKPARLVVSLRERGRTTAKAEFDLQGQARIATMAVEAKAQADQNVEAYRELIADGKTARECPGA
jgi:hypothetical protein